MTEKDDFDLYVFRICSGINQKLGLSLDVKSNKLYILSFSLTAQEPENIKNVTGYEVYFTKELLNKETIMLSDKLELFKSELPKMYLISQHQEWRVKEIFECMLDESTRRDFHRNEMIRTLMHELILFSQRLLTVDTNPV